MSRIAKLNTTEVTSILALKDKLPVDKLVKKLKVSRSTIYRIFEGSYHARPNPAPVAPTNLSDMDGLTVATVQFVLAKTNLERLIGHPLHIH